MKKVTAKNLMIGDWVMHEKHQMKVKELTIMANKHRIFFEGSIFGTYSATPIPITEEWLLGNGYRKYPDSFFIYENKSIMITYGFELGLRVYRDNITLSWNLNIQYIHQLQQAYRLATGGKELKVKF
jgi:hypothetical protein